MGFQHLITRAEEINDFIHLVPLYKRGNIKSIDVDVAKYNLIKYNTWKELVLDFVRGESPSSFREFERLFEDVERGNSNFPFSQIIGKLNVILNKTEQSDDNNGKLITGSNKGKLKITKSSDDAGEEIEVEGLTDGHIHIYNQQFQHQDINIDIFIQSIKNELSDDQIKQLKELIDEETDSKSKKKSICDKLLSFGSDVAAKILAEIITKPEVFGMFFPC